MNYLQKFFKEWQYVQTYLIDHEHGDWYEGGIDQEPQRKTSLKAQIWKGTYHVFRALMNCINRIEEDKNKQPLSFTTGQFSYKIEWRRME